MTSKAAVSVVASGVAAKLIIASELFMPRALTLLWFAFITIDSAAMAAEPDRIDPVWLEKAKNEGKTCYDRYVALSGRLEERSETRFDLLPGGPPPKTPYKPQVHRLWVVSSGGNMIVERARSSEGDSKPRIMLECENHQYSFALSRKDIDSPYVLVGYKLGQQSKLANSLSGLHTDAFHAFRQALDAIEGRKGSTLKAIHWDDSRKLLHIRSIFLVGGTDASPQELWVDPENSWRVVEYSRETKYAKFATEVTYGQTIEGLSLPTGFKNTSTYKPGVDMPGQVITGKLESIRLADKSDRDFTLTAFGLPEPVDATPLPRRTPRYVWFLAGALVCAVAAFLLRHLARRRVGLPIAPDQATVS